MSYTIQNPEKKVATMEQVTSKKAARRVDQFFGGDNDAMELAAESPATEIMKIESEGDPEVMLMILEKKAALAPRFRAALDAILVSQTYPEDWKEFDGTMCLSSAGAERVGRNFPIQIFEVHWQKEEWTDAKGNAYRFVYEAKAAMGGHIVYVTGAYGTRDPFLGKKGDDFRAIEEINPTMLQNAAYHILCGSAVKAILGLRGIPKTEWDKMMSRTGRNGAKTGNVQHGSGTQGGTTADDSVKQKELAEICIAIANAGKMVVSQDFKTFSLEDMSEISDPTEVAKQSCINLSTFIGRENKKVTGLGAKELKGVRLDKTLEKAREMQKQLGEQQ